MAKRQRVMTTSCTTTTRMQKSQTCQIAGKPTTLATLSVITTPMWCMEEETCTGDTTVPTETRE
eukprot:3850694-Amphidinium_carterae.3